MLDKVSAAALLKEKRYDSSILPQLEEYVSSATHDLDASIATLKLYQFNPEKLQTAVVAKILVKALTALPQTDYLMCTYLLPDRLHDTAPISTIAEAANMLETCCFREFWGSLDPLRAELLKGLPGFDDGVRDFMLGVFERTYQSVPSDHLAASLGVGAAALKPIVTKRGWTIEGDLVKISLNADNQAKPKKVEMSSVMDTSQMTKILSSVAASNS